MLPTRLTTLRRRHDKSVPDPQRSKPHADCTHASAGSRESARGRPSPATALRAHAPPLALVVPGSIPGVGLYVKTHANVDTAERRTTGH
jgi:hypothetical protein